MSRNEDGLMEVEYDLGIKAVHLTTGEDIVGRVKQYVRGNPPQYNYVIEEPVVPNVGVNPAAPTNFRVSLIPLRPYLDTKSIKIAGEHVIFVADVQDGFANLYTQYTSNIVVAQPSDIPTIVTE